jgi:assimilatory nitrate reductase catalytic subunit
MLKPDDGVKTIWNEHRESTRGHDLDITGMRYAMLEATPQQWPLTEGQSKALRKRCFSHTSGKACFVNTVYKPVAKPRESRFPFTLTTGRLRDQWHGMTRTGTLGRLFGHVAEPSVQMNPQDMSRRLLVEGALVHVTSKHSSIVVPVQARGKLVCSCFNVSDTAIDACLQDSSQGISLTAGAGFSAAPTAAPTAALACPNSSAINVRPID